MQNSSLTGSTVSNSNINMLNQMDNASGQVVQGTPDVPAASKGRKTKKRKFVDIGIKADSARVCNICNVVCNSQEVFDKHLSGKKHAAQVSYIHMLASLNCVTLVIISFFLMVFLSVPIYLFLFIDIPFNVNINALSNGKESMK